MLDVINPCTHISTLNPKDLGELLTDSRIARRVAVENLALVAMGLRACSQITIPAELPSGEAIGVAIDARFKPQMERLRKIQDQKAKVKVIGEIRKGLASAFEELVEDSQGYKAIISWAKRLDLNVDQVEVRPTIHEIYLYRDRDVLNELRGLMRERGKLRVEALRRLDPPRSQLQFAYPEEFNGQWVTRMGRLLDYPDCCVDMYALDRVEGVNVEARAASQLKELCTDPDPYVYLAGYFFPCTPTCKRAREKGELYHRKLSEALSEAGDAYEAITRENLDRVRRQPEIIGEYLSRLRGA